MLQIFGRDPAGNVSVGTTWAIMQASSRRLFRIASSLFYFTMDLKKKGARISRDFMISVSETIRCLCRELINVIKNLSLMEPARFLLKQ
jgi:hypothetical protein